MAQATLLGLGTENVVTILTPSSTIETPLGSRQSDAAITGSGTLFLYTPIQLQVPTTNMYIVFGSLTITAPFIADITISIGTFLWSQQVAAGVISVPFQTISRGPPTLLVTGFIGSASYTYTATTLR
jgi:hypothetical protein